MTWANKKWLFCQRWFVCALDIKRTVHWVYLCFCRSRVWIKRDGMGEGGGYHSILPISVSFPKLGGWGKEFRNVIFPAERSLEADIFNYMTNQRKRQKIADDRYFLSPLFFKKSLKGGGRKSPLFSPLFLSQILFSNKRGERKSSFSSSSSSSALLTFDWKPTTWLKRRRKEEEEGGGRRKGKGGIFGGRDSFLPFLTPILWRGRKLYVAQVAITVYFFFGKTASPENYCT